MKPAILLIDDSPGDRAILREALALGGIGVIEAGDGREGVRLFREHRPALVLVDIIMPEKDGIETAREILSIDPRAVIFTVSGKDATGDYQEIAKRLGVRRGFTKPVRIDELLGAVRLQLRGATARFAQTYKEGFRITVQDGGVLIEAIDYHTEPLFLDEAALGNMGLKLNVPSRHGDA